MQASTSRDAGEQGCCSGEDCSRGAQPTRSTVKISQCFIGKCYLVLFIKPPTCSMISMLRRLLLSQTKTEAVRLGALVLASDPVTYSRSQRVLLEEMTLS